MAKIANASLSQQQKQRQAETATTTTTTVAASVETATTTARSRDRTKSAAQITSHLLKRAISVYSSPQWIPLFILIYLATGEREPWEGASEWVRGRAIGSRGHSGGESEDGDMREQHGVYTVLKLQWSLHSTELARYKLLKCILDAHFKWNL